MWYPFNENFNLLVDFEKLKTRKIVSFVKVSTGIQVYFGPFYYDSIYYLPTKTTLMATF